MRGERAERFAVLSLRVLALSFAVVGILFIAVPNGVLDTISDLGDEIGGFSRAPHGTEQLWLALGFYFFDDDVFAYLLNFLVDGSLVLVALWLWSLTGRIDRQPGAG